MAYLDPKPLSPSRIWAIIIVIAIHVLGLYAMLNGGYQYTKKVLTDLDVIEVKEPPPPPKPLPPPPPPDTKLPPPPVVPPPIVQTNTPTPPPMIVATPTPPPVYVPPPVAPVITPPPPPPAITPVRLTPRGSPGSWVTNDDYPPSAQRDGIEGTTGFSLDVAANGRVTNCTVTSSSGSQLLDDTACRLLMRRARFNPGKDANGNATGGVYAGRFRWQIQK